ncbi:MAG: hypothetical protein DMF77_22910 [Acidobacteria bacterium]|nr:MAG: hypothetical protein DMF77_22910 [Acidobacteriota bacterium]
MSGRGAGTPRSLVDEGLDVAVAVAASGAFAVLSILMHVHSTRSFDRRAWRMRWPGPRSRRPRRTVERISGALSPLTFGFAGSVVALLLRAKRRREASDSVLASSALASLADPALKASFRRRRPPEMWLSRSSDSSFPSGHSMSACAVPAILSYVLARERLISPAGAMALATIPPLGVGITRLYLHKHWATDVLAGWAAGLAFAGGAAAWYESRGGASERVRGRAADGIRS